LQKLTQVSNYDIWYLDNFYDNPDHVRNCALISSYINSSNSKIRYPGIRTEDMHSDKECKDKNLKDFYLYFLKTFNEKVSLFNVNDCLNISTCFHKISVINRNLKSPLNTGYIHVDLLDYRIKNKKTFAGLVYLNKIANSNSGTSFFKLKSTSAEMPKIIDNDNFELFNSSFGGYDYGFLFNEYVNLYNPFLKRKHWNYCLENKQFVDSKFEKIAEVQNVHNRLVLYDSTYFHTASHFYVNNFEDRLTQPFFIKML